MQCDMLHRLWSESGQKPALPRRSIGVRFALNKQTLTERVQCDAMCHKATYAVQQSKRYYSITSSAIGHKRRQAIQFVLGPAVFNRDVLTLDVAGLLEPLSKPPQAIRLRNPITGIGGTFWGKPKTQ